MLRVTDNSRSKLNPSSGNHGTGIFGLEVFHIVLSSSNSNEKLSLEKEKMENIQGSTSRGNSNKIIFLKSLFTRSRLRVSDFASAENH